MGENFRGWKRSVSLVPFLLTCVLAIAWIRSLFIFDEAIDVRFCGYSYNLISGSGHLECSWGTARLPNWLRHTLRSRPVETSFDTWGFNSSNRWRGNWAAFNWIKPEFRFGPDAGSVGDGFIVQYWFMVVPLTTLSAWRLLSRGRQPKANEQPLRQVV